MTFIEQLRYVPRKDRRFFWFWTGVNAIFLIGGIVMMCFGMESGGYGFLLCITYIPFYSGMEDMAEVFSRDPKNLN